MFRYSWFAANVVLLIAGIAWCIAILARWREDLATLRNSSDPVEQWVVIGYWTVTAIVLLLLATYGFGTLREFDSRLTGLL